MRYLKFFSILIAIGSLLVACGGGGSGSSTFGGFEEGLSGEYRLIGYGGFGVNLTDITFDGAGNGNYAGVSDSTNTGDFTYKLAEDGELRIYPDPGDPTFFVKGQTDGNLLLTYDNDDSDGSVQIAAGVGKVDTTFTTLSEADLNGKFRFVEAGGDGTTAYTAVFDVTFDGSNTATINSYENSDGVTTAPAPVTYSVAPNGELTIDGMVGQINSKGTVVVFADDDPTDDGFMSGAIGFMESVTDLDGDYTVGQFTADTPTTSVSIYTSEILMMADSSATPDKTITGTWVDSDGTSGAIPAGLTYMVDGTTGNLTMSSGDVGQVKNGAFIAADIDATDDSIMMMFGIKKYVSIFK